MGQMGPLLKFHKTATVRVWHFLRNFFFFHLLNFFFLGLIQKGLMAA